MAGFILEHPHLRCRIIGRFFLAEARSKVYLGGSPVKSTRKGENGMGFFQRLFGKRQFASTATSPSPHPPLGQHLVPRPRVANAFGAKSPQHARLRMSNQVNGTVGFHESFLVYPGKARPELRRLD